MGDRVLLLCSPGLEYVASFFGCLYAGRVAVPVYPPGPGANVNRIATIARDADPVMAVVSQAADLPAASVPGASGPDTAGRLGELQWLSAAAVRRGRQDTWTVPEVSADSVAFLQYTSGSTTEPKGVMVTHDNLLANVRAAEKSFGMNAGSVGVSWLPPYHDMGLIGGIIYPLATGYPATLMSPTSFVRDPGRWLEAISDFRATISPAPNFAYKMCVDRIRDDVLSRIDLSSWTVAPNGAEPVRAEILDQFAAAFGQYGFRRDSFYPCYGLAENTLLVSGGRSGSEPTVRLVSRPELEAGWAKPSQDAHTVSAIVSSGQVADGVTVVIADPESRHPAADCQVGEIWVSGSSVGAGYFRSPEATEQSFGASLADGSGPYLRTGDLGVVLDGELFVTGRSSDLMILWGRNIYPQDVEATCCASHRVLHAARCAAFSVDYGGKESLVIVQEVSRRRISDSLRAEIVSAIRRRVAEEYQIQVHEIVLVPARKIPTTSSGKIQRRACRRQYLEGALPPVSLAPGPDDTSSASIAAGGYPSERGARSSARFPAADIEHKLVELVSRSVGCEAADVDVRQPFATYGIDSVKAISLAAELSAWLGREVEPTLAWDYPTVGAAASYLAAETAGEVPVVVPTAAAPDEPVAVVGMACRLPGGAGSPEELWRLVAGGVDAVSGFPLDRGWDVAGLFDPERGRPGKCYVREGGFVDAGEFDPDLFGISPREALAMDPQQRLVLEVCWEALERAGIDPLSVKGSAAGVFIGAGQSGYVSGLGQVPDGLEGYLATGTAASVISGRVAYVLGLEGPALSVDTACSSSLVALHLAGQALRQGECSLALAGGVTVMCTPAAFVAFSAQRGLAPDGRCKAFSAAADGTGWSEGTGVLVLERLSAARRNGHRVLAVLRGSAVNQDGASNGLAAPNGPSQQRVIRQALANAGLSAREVDVVEAHGTGTALGDPIEAQALLATYGRDRQPGRPLWLGSVKSNIGHAQAAAGAAGVIKMVMALVAGVLPKTLHADEPSPHVDWSGEGVRLLAEARPWLAEGGPRRAGVSSFGISGTNAHLILEEAPSGEPGRGGPGVPAGVDEGAAGCGLVTAGAVPWVVCGRGAGALRAQAARLRDFVAADPALGAADVGLSLVTTRAALEHRGVVTGQNREELLGRLDALARGVPAAGVVQGTARGGNPRVVFVFSGQGGQWPGMAAELLASSPVFGAAMRACGDALEPLTGWSVVDVLRGAADAPPLERVDVVQPALFSVMVSLAELWRFCGVAPAAVVGHSQGEIAAACVAGGLSLDDAAKVVARRSQALLALAVGGDGAGGGGMASAALPGGQARQRVARWDGRLSVAAVNGPSSVVISGDPGALEEFVSGCESDGIRARRIAVDYAAHSVQVEQVREQLLADLGGITPCPSDVPFYSAAVPGLMDTAGLDAGYWYRNLREPVEFEAATRALLADGYRVFVESSPHPVLAPAVQETADGAEVVTAGSLRRGEGGPNRFLASLGEAFTAGVRVNWAAVFADSGARQVDLPTYAFQRQRFWLDAPPQAQPGGGTADSGFWDIVQRGDAAVLATELGVDGDEARASLGAVLPALSSWHQRQRERSLLDSWRYRMEWKPLPGVPGGTLAGTWLVVLPAGVASAETVEAYAQAVAGRCAGVVRVAVDPADVSRAVLAQRVSVALTGQPVAGVVSLLALDEAPCPGHPAVPRGVAATLALLQALGDEGVSAPLWCLTRGAVSTGLSDPPGSPAQAQVWGLGRVAALEFPHRWGGLIDLPFQLGERVLDRLCGVLADSRGEDQIAVRPSGILGARLQRAPLDPGAPVRRWAPHGTVLITGGTGALGRCLARWLAREGAAHLVLVSRRGCGAPGAADLEAELTALGTQVTIAACDIANRAALAELVRQVEAAGSPIRAVIHTAAAITLDPLEQASVADLADAIAAKAGGAQTLDELFSQANLDAFVLFSSVAGTWGARDYGMYAAANAYLDALAHHRRARGLPVTCIAWGSWEILGAADSDPSLRAAVSDLALRNGLPPMDEGLAITALRQALDHDETSLAVAAIDWDRFASVFTLARPGRLIDDIPEARRASTAERGVEGSAPAIALALAGLSAAEQSRAVADLVRGHLAAVLGHDGPAAIDESRAFRDLGVDSVAAVELRNRLHAATGLHLPATVVFDHPTASALASYMAALIIGDEEEAAAKAPLSQVTGPTDAVAEDSVVIVGMSCRLPGGIDTPEGLWRAAIEERDVISGPPADRGWDMGKLLAEQVELLGLHVLRSGGFIDGAGEFDAEFFGIPPHEALAMDPQHRILLELAWEAIERAGVDPRSLRRARVGVFAGTFSQAYWTGLEDVPAESGPYILSGMAPAYAAGRIAYTLGLEGPTLTVDTGCSSSAVALHLACQAVRRGECSMALVGGVSVFANPAVAPELGAGASPDGRCKAFAAGADGTGWGEGAGMLLIERLSEATKRGHPTWAVIRGSAVNHDGGTNGLGAPSVASQQEVISQALADAKLTAGQVDVVEAHGTGTPLGDSIEANALIATYGRAHDVGHPLWLGTIKANIGHPQAASGVVGVIKMAMAMRHGRLPRTLNAAEPTPHVDWEASAVRLLTETMPWPGTGRPRRAGVSSFGGTGTKVHVILEEASSRPAAHAADRSARPGVPGMMAGALPCVVSGRTGPALHAQAQRLADYLASRPALDLADVAWSLASRSAFPHRAVVMAADREGLLSGLAALARAEPCGHVIAGTAANSASAAFLFSGQVDSQVTLARDLYAASPVFADALDAVCAPLDLELEESLPAAVFTAETSVGAGLLQRPAYAEAASFAAQVAFCRLLQTWGVTIDLAVCRARGDIAAAHVAGLLSLEQAATLIAARARLMQNLAPGHSAAAPGDDDRPMRKSDFRRVAAGMPLRSPRMPVISAQTGEVISRDDMATPEYWLSAAADPDAGSGLPPRQRETIAALFHMGHHAWGGAPAARPGNAGQPHGSPARGVPTPGATQGHPAMRGLAAMLAEAHVRGVDVDWAAVLSDSGARLADLPTYAFQRDPFWLASPSLGRKP